MRRRRGRGTEDLAPGPAHGEDLPEEDAHLPDVAAEREDVAGELLGGHGAGRALDVRRLEGPRGAQVPRGAEVADLGAHVGGEDDVLAVEVAVDEVVVVDVGHARRHLARHAQAVAPVGQPPLQPEDVVEDVAQLAVLKHKA